jgi:preprotein translocase subunit SecY
MASAAEQLAASMNFGALSKATELKKRIWFTLGALIIYRLGTYIPAPGIDPVIMQQIFEQQSSSSSPAAFWACSTCSPAARLGA